MGIAPPAVSAACHQALVQELGPARGQPAFSDEPNLQLLRSLHAGDASGEGLVSSLSLGASLSQLGVHLSPEVTSDILLQSYVDGETQVGQTAYFRSTPSGWCIPPSCMCVPFPRGGLLLRLLPLLFLSLCTCARRCGAPRAWRSARSPSTTTRF